MSSQDPSEKRFRETADHLSSLVHEFETLPYPHLRERASELLQAVDALHRVPLERLVSLLEVEGQTALLNRMAEDPLVRGLLALYDLVPLDDLTQVELALDTVRPYLQDHGGDVELLDIMDGMVHLRLSGTCVDCAGWKVTLKSGIEVALRDGFTGFKGIQLHESPRMAVAPAEVERAIVGGAGD